MKSQLVPSYSLFDICGHQTFETRRVKNIHLEMALKAHRHNYYTIIFHQQGTATHVVDMEKIIVTKPSLICITPDQVHQSIETTLFESVLISFTEDFQAVEKLISRWDSKTNVIELSEEETIYFSLLTDFMVFEFDRKESNSTILKNSLNSLILKINELTFKQHNVVKSNAGRMLVVKYYDLVNKHFRQTKNVLEYADKLNITASHLNETIKKSIGKTAKEIITDRLIAESKRLLYFDNISMKEIAVHLDFTEINYFSTFFKKHTGEPPMAFRNRIREKYN